MENTPSRGRLEEMIKFEKTVIVLDGTSLAIQEIDVIPLFEKATHTFGKYNILRVIIYTLESLLE